MNVADSFVEHPSYGVRRYRQPLTAKPLKANPI
jgi:hypothetical protein